MTAQIPDEVLYEGTWFAVTAVGGTGLFNPAAHVLQPGLVSTACHRGFVCRYAITEGQLVLRSLELGSKEEPPALGGVQPRQNERRNWHYQELAITVGFTGRLLIGIGDVADRPYLNMGFWPAWMYSEVYELTFRAGALLSAADRSAELAAVRASHASRAARPAPGEATGDWVSRTFSLTYHYSWPGRS